MSTTENTTNRIKIFGTEITRVDSWFILALIIIGVILLLYSSRNKNRWTLILGFLLIAAAILSLFTKSQEFRDILVALASIFAVIFSAISLYQSERIRKDSLDKENRDRKERYLDEIIEWALNIQKSSIEIEIPEIEKLKKYGIPFSMNAYISRIIEKSFSILSPDFLDLQATFVGFMYLKYKVLGAATPRGAFEGVVYIKVIDVIDSELSNIENKENAARQMLKQYEHDLEKYTTLFLVKLADAKSSTA